MKGYNVLRGFPGAMGSDPGFQFPIFVADYSKQHHTADCRYSLPSGFVATPDVSCVVTFSSKVVDTVQEFSSSLSASAHVSGGGWGVHFSASTAYKEAQSEMQSNNMAYVLSKAGCSYYYTELVKNDPPPFQQAFIDWVKVLEQLTTSKDDYSRWFEFLDTYGTHYVSYMEFGASYMFENKMTATKLAEMQSSGLDVSAEASYSGLFSVSGGFSMSTEQRAAASRFQKDVTTKTITVGAPPPATGDASVWASTVKEDPVPVTYELVSIENLFTESYMKRLNVNYTKIHSNIVQLKFEYCQSLMFNGEVDSCTGFMTLNDVQFTDTRFTCHSDMIWKSSEDNCIKSCVDEPTCIGYSRLNLASSNCRLITTDSLADGMCKYGIDDNNKVRKESNWVSKVLLGRLTKNLSVQNTLIADGPLLTSINVGGYPACLSRCQDVVTCVAFSFQPSAARNCRLMSKRVDTGLEQKVGSTTTFMART